MPKLKTRKNVIKRYQVKKSKKGLKILKRTDGQDHFNSRESGNTKRNKRRDNSLQLTKTQKTIVRAVQPAGK
jgi:ribosomal protein L35